MTVEYVSGVDDEAVCAARIQFGAARKALLKVSTPPIELVDSVMISMWSTKVEIIQTQSWAKSTLILQRPSSVA